MGRCVLDLAARDERFAIAAALTAPGCLMSGKAIRVGDRDAQVVERLETECDVLIDFSLPAGTMAWLSVCEGREIPIVIGVTGHDAVQSARIREAARRIPILLSANFSVGVNAILELIEPLVRALGDGYDIEIVETHHRHKVDAPSGTALAMARELQASRSEEGEIIFGRKGPTGERPSRQIAIHALRMGDAVGQHEIHFSGCGETITIRHTAHSRETFAAGALRAAAWIVGRDAGLYTICDVLSSTAKRGLWP